MGKAYTIRNFRSADAPAVSALIAKTLRITNSKDYVPEYIENVVKKFGPQEILQRAACVHYYVICEGVRIVGCGGIGPYRDKEDESCFYNIFVAPEYQGKGLGRKIMETLEKDKFFLRAKRIEIAASITACGFYRKLGYTYKDGNDALNDDGLFCLEKYL